jgi:2-polyprenyl-3-methyl-5-hydroxy-6-metoxy-1,4-benzoquinol methylase
MSFLTRSYEKELLDMDGIPFSDIRTTMEELDTVNTMLGGHSITCRGIDHFLRRLPADRELSIAEIGCGGGDNLRIIGAYLQSQNRKYRLIGVDIKDECVTFARMVANHPVSWICSDYRTTQWPAGNKPDIIFSSLFCHHFTDEQLGEQLAWLKENSTLGFFINDLHRHPVAYHSIKLLTKIFSKSYLVKNDGPLSVKRSFTKPEWQKLLHTAGIRKYKISWHWAFRYLVCVDNECN